MKEVKRSKWVLGVGRTIICMISSILQALGILVRAHLENGSRS